MANYTTNAKVKAFIGKTADTTIDTKINNALPWVDALINRHTKRQFLSITVTNEKTQSPEERRTNLMLYSDTLGLYLLPILTITALTEGGSTMVSETDFFINKQGGFLTKENAPGWNTGRRWLSYWSTTMFDIIFSGTFGYAAVPPDIEAVATEMAAIIVLEKTKTYDTAEGVATSVITSFPQYVKDTLDAYRVRPI